MPENKLLAALPEAEYQRLCPYLEYTSLTVGQVLYQPNELIQQVYFPIDAMVSLVSTVESGSTIEIGLVGAEGMVGIPVFLGGNFTTNRGVVQIAGDALRMNAERLRIEFKGGETLHHLLLLYTQALLTQVSQTAVCNRLHKVEQRLARWLLSVQYSLQKDEFELTQEFLANMLGTSRPTITEAANNLSQAGLIRYSRGQITILNQEGLEDRVCECYELVKSEFIRLLEMKCS